MPSGVPTGRSGIWVSPSPSDKSLGYYQMSLRDEHSGPRKRLASGPFTVLSATGGNRPGIHAGLAGVQTRFWDGVSPVHGTPGSPSRRRRRPVNGHDAAKWMVEKPHRPLKHEPHVQRDIAGANNDRTNAVQPLGRIVLVSFIKVKGHSRFDQR